VREARLQVLSWDRSGGASWVYLDANNQTRKEEVCRCARKRFLKKHSAEIVIEGERDWKWKECWR
jgi:hypothetical protein